MNSRFFKVIFFFAFILAIFPFNFEKIASAASPPMMMVVDSPSSDGNTINSNYKVEGWALADEGIDKVRVFIDDVSQGYATYGLSRPDVYNVFPAYNNSNAGYSFTLNPHMFGPGTHILKVQVFSKSGNKTEVTRSFRKTTLQTMLVLDEPVADGEIWGNATVRGWALAHYGISKVSVYIDTILKGNATYGLSRPDVYNVFPAYNNSNAGYSFTLDTSQLSLGPHNLYVKITTNDGGTTTIKRTVQVVKKVKIGTSFSIFDGPDMGTKMYKTLGPQYVTVVKEGDKGWLLIKTSSLGEKWINPTLESDYNTGRAAVRQKLGYNEYDYVNNYGALDQPNTLSLQKSSKVSRKKMMIPTKEEIKAYQEKKKKAKINGVSQLSAPANWPRKGDIIVTPDNNFGLTGHIAIVARDYDDSPDQYGEYIQIVHAPGIGDFHPAVKIQPLASWEFEYSQLWYFRYPDQEKAKRAAQYAVNNLLLLQNQYRYYYMITPNMTQDDEFIYCSELIYRSYASGAGVHFYDSITEKGIVHPLDFYALAQQNKLLFYFSTYTAKDQT